MLRVLTSFQDSPGDGYFPILYYGERPLEEQCEELGLKDGDVIELWDVDTGDYTVKATLLFNFDHPMGVAPGLWAKELPD